MPRHVCCANKSGGGEFFSSSAINQYAPSKVIEPIHHGNYTNHLKMHHPKPISIDINLIFKGLENKSFIGKVTITFKHNGLALVSNTDELSCITLNAENFEDVQVAGDDLKDYRYDGHHLWIYWQTPFTKHSERLVTIDYTVEKPIGGLYFNKGDEIIGSTPLFAITDHETEKYKKLSPI
jgi:aminopeptidase N